MTIQCETAIIGAGLIGSGLAMHLMQKGASDLHVVDFDLEGAFSSSELNAGGVRATMVQPVNILLSKHSIEYMAANVAETGYRDCGYLWLHPPERFPLAQEARKKQVELGWTVEEFGIEELQKRVPFIDKTDGIQGCHFGVKDGLMNPNLMKMHFRSEAKKSGAVFHDRSLVRSFEEQTNAPYRYRLQLEVFDASLSRDSKAYVLTGKKHSQVSTLQTIETNQIVNCAGPWAPDLATILGYSSPSYPVRRQVSIFDVRDIRLSDYGMIVDPSGVYFHPEAMNGLAGFADPSEPAGKNYVYDGEEFFVERIWSVLYERSSKLERLRHLTGWAGLYEVSPDKSAIIGKVRDGIYESHSFSGHGAMQSYAAGLSLAELMIDGQYQTIDLSGMSGRRFDEHQLLPETLVI